MVTNIQGRLQNEINAVAQIHFYISRVIEAGLKSTMITPEGRTIVGEYNTESDRWRDSLAQSNYPAEDVYWFEPLDRLNLHIEEARRFFRQFPS
jgi:hypothetical protein